MKCQGTSEEKKKFSFLQRILLNPEYVLVYVCMYSQRHIESYMPRCKRKYGLEHEGIPQKVFRIDEENYIRQCISGEKFSFKSFRSNEYP